MINVNNNSVTNNIGKMFGKVSSGLCRLSTNGIAIKTQDGYKAYDVSTGTLVNCADFVFDIGDDMFFCVPCNDIKKGDIILSSGKPVCVISVTDGRIEALRYEDSTIVTIVPENIMFLGTNYFYSKIVSLFGDMSNGVKAENILPFMFMSEAMKGENKSGFSQILPFMLMSKGNFNFSNMFSGIFGNTKTNNSTVDCEVENDNCDKNS